MEVVHVHGEVYGHGGLSIICGGLFILRLYEQVSIYLIRVVRSFPFPPKTNLNRLYPS